MLPLILTAAVSLTALGDTERFGVDVGRTAQTIVLADSVWNVVGGNYWNRPGSVVAFGERDMTLRSQGTVQSSGLYSVEPGAGSGVPSGFRWGNLRGTCHMESDRLVIDFRQGVHMVLILERQKP
jgi:hypothetical protein